MVGATRHNLNLFALMVGDTAKARKGTSQQEILRFFRALDSLGRAPEFSLACRLVRDSSGVRDPIAPGDDGETKTEVVDEAKDKRLLVLEPEFASTLKVLKREGNTLSPLIRQAWDGGVLNTLTSHHRQTPTSPSSKRVASVTPRRRTASGTDS